MPLHQIRRKLKQNMDYLFWSVCSVELKKNSTKLPSRASECREKIRCYTLNIDQIITVVNDILPRAQACIESDRGAFEYKLKSFKKRFNRYFFTADIFSSSVQH